ncbi:DNA-binding protein Alba [Candidatus Bathyarchaeota archaeon]|nr:DNA-binding protein Alba [Candidatus Bathyarchaeota archaeon]
MSEKSNVVFIGRKPTMNYVLAVITGFSTLNSEEVVLKARGRAISTAIDVAEITRRRFLSDVKVKDIKIGTDQIERVEDGGISNVSTIEVILSK